ncbi:flagellar hook protein FlgE [Ramlibacter alkalitolerans]|uniref:Flagellar hook protein FlgE n=1 Tax=Ramlibacter alkalitolerans TaxID=2039631 RepID=A0ABS1JT85_9BURK|nr:flagellar hook-basal body complex protein [Ramlibacter alkalitolerans]MBL0427386.1 flagellar hook-basal body complex protein [Ramlibacter alkalitolerans]
MLDSIHVGFTGLQAFQQGLRVIANNTTNLNTPGFKASNLQFSDLMDASSSGTKGGEAALGHGVDALASRVDWRQGDFRQTGNDFDLALDGQGLFVLRDGQGQTRYTRSGQFQFDAAGVLLNRADGSKVLGRSADGTLGEISMAGLRTNAGKATEVARFTGNLSSTATEQTVGSVQVHDGAGGEHNLQVRLTSLAPDKEGRWKVELLDGSTSVGEAELAFEDGLPTAATSKLSFSYTPAGRSAQPLTLDFSSDVTSFASGSLSTLAMTSQDGFGPGALTKLAFDATGVLVATYSNGQTSKGVRLALGRFSTPDAVRDLGDGLYAETGGVPWLLGAAGDAGFASVRAGSLEISNVDLSREFSDLVIMQRGYQASSQIVSTANDMLQELFGMKHK